MWEPKVRPGAVNPVRNLLDEALRSYNAVLDTSKNQTETTYLPKMKEQDLQKAILFNKFYGPEKESEIGLRGAHTGETNAHKRLLEQQLQQAIMQQQLFKHLMGNGGAQNEPEEINYPSAAGQQMPSPNQMMPSPQQNPQQLQMPSSQQMPISEKPSMTYSQAAAAMKMLGMGQPKIENINGRYVAITPFGNIEVAQGQTPLQKELVKTDAKKISDLENTVLTADKKLTTLHDLSKVVTSPTFEEMRTNPILGKHELGWFEKLGTKEQQNLAGKFLTETGEIIRDASQDFKGQFRKGEQELLESTKPVKSDSLDVMKGKLEAMTFLVQALADRSQMEAELMRERGLSPLQARKEVNNIFNPEGIKAQIKDMLQSKGRPTKEGVFEEIKKRKIIG